MAPAALIDLPRSSRLYYNEPFGPVDTIVLVDRIEELVAEMNVSNGCLVASIACDEPATAKSIAGQLRAFEVGINAVRSRGDCNEYCGGLGESWKGYFGGGRLLVEAVTMGRPGSNVYGNFVHEVSLPGAT
jgi:acyl-CoA reductase-like NAD-dependent aldehyde dehydrogenase